MLIEMIESAKKIIPLPIRDLLRPYYLRMSRALKSSRMWPKPSSWRVTKAELGRHYSISDYYSLAQSEFGIIQIETEIVSLIDFVGKCSPRIVGEIGMKEGGNSFLFTQALKGVELFITLDLRINNEAKLRYLSGSGQKIICLEGDSHTPETVEKVKRRLGSKRFDLLFIDGDHSYEGVKQDFLLYAPLVRKGGLVAFHDIVPDDFARYGKPSGNCYSGGVHIFWTEIKKQFVHHEFIDNHYQNGFGIGVIIL